jgi:glycosyltransferase involved in cell wall biosynthesis
MSSRPRRETAVTSPSLTIGLPVYNGERYLRTALDDLLAQTYDDFELVISDNASTDSTPEICREYAARDPRIRYVRQSANIGAVPNHNILLDYARGRYFKWASHDDRYEPELLEACVHALEGHPELVLAHSWDGTVDELGQVVDSGPYLLDTANPRPAARLRSLLFTDGGNDFYGVFRTEDLRAVKPLGSYPHSDRTFMAELCLRGTFHQVPDVLFYRREHEQRTTHAASPEALAASYDPRRKDDGKGRVGLYAEYVGEFVRIIWCSSLSPGEKLRCYAELGRWLADRLRPSRVRRLLHGADSVETVAT